MSKTFPKIGTAITMAAKEGGPDPANNAKLRLAIQAAKAANMPKDNVENAIKRASGKDAAEIKEVNYEGKGPHGVMIFIECATDNSNRSVTNIKTIFNKNNGQMVNTTENVAANQRAFMATGTFLGIALMIGGAALFVRYSMARYLRFWLIRLVHESRVNTERVVDAIEGRSR